MKRFVAKLQSPDGHSVEYAADARNKTSARKKIAEQFRLDNPPRCGFYPFSKQIFTWVEYE